MAGILIDFIFKALFNTHFDIRQYTRKERKSIQTKCYRQQLSKKCSLKLNRPENRARQAIFICWTFIAKNVCHQINEKKEILFWICFVLSKKNDYSKKIIVLISSSFGSHILFSAEIRKICDANLLNAKCFKQWAEKSIHSVKEQKMREKLQTNILKNTEISEHLLQREKNVPTSGMITNRNECVKVQNILFKVEVIVKFMVHPFVKQFIS